MTELKGNLWSVPADIRVITTNGVVKTNGEAVMGRGCGALEAARKYPGLPHTLGRMIEEGGNHVHILVPGPFDHSTESLVSFPVKSWTLVPGHGGSSSRA